MVSTEHNTPLSSGANKLRSEPHRESLSRQKRLTKEQRTKAQKSHKDHAITDLEDDPLVSLPEYKVSPKRPTSDDSSKNLQPAKKARLASPPPLGSPERDQKPGINSLSEELRNKIVEYCDLKTALLPLSLVSRQWNDSAARRIFRSIKFDLKNGLVRIHKRQVQRIKDLTECLTFEVSSAEGQEVSHAMIACIVKRKLRRVVYSDDSIMHTSVLDKLTETIAKGQLVEISFPSIYTDIIPAPPNSRIPPKPIATPEALDSQSTPLKVRLDVTIGRGSTKRKMACQLNKNGEIASTFGPIFKVTSGEQPLITNLVILSNPAIEEGDLLDFMSKLRFNAESPAKHLTRVEFFDVDLSNTQVNEFESFSAEKLRTLVVRDCLDVNVDVNVFLNWLAARAPLLGLKRIYFRALWVQDMFLFHQTSLVPLVRALGTLKILEVIVPTVGNFNDWNMLSTSSQQLRNVALRIGRDLSPAELMKICTLCPEVRNILIDCYTLTGVLQLDRGNDHTNPALHKRFHLGVAPAISKLARLQKLQINCAPPVVPRTKRETQWRSGKWVEVITERHRTVEERVRNLVAAVDQSIRRDKSNDWLYWNSLVWTTHKANYDRQDVEADKIPQSLTFRRVEREENVNLQEDDELPKRGMDEEKEKVIRKVWVVEG